MSYLPGTPDVVVTNFGLLYPAQRRRLGTGLRRQLRRAPARQVRRAADGRMMAAGPNGFYVSADGCQWTMGGGELAGKILFDVAPDPAVAGPGVGAGRDRSGRCSDPTTAGSASAGVPLPARPHAGAAGRRPQRQPRLYVFGRGRDNITPTLVSTDEGELHQLRSRRPGHHRPAHGAGLRGHRPRRPAGAVFQRARRRGRPAMEDQRRRPDRAPHPHSGREGRLRGPGVRRQRAASCTWAAATCSTATASRRPPVPLRRRRRHLAAAHRLGRARAALPLPDHQRRQAVRLRRRASRWATSSWSASRAMAAAPGPRPPVWRTSPAPAAA